MIRTQIQLTEEQARVLREVAVAEGRSMAGVIRESFDAYVASRPAARSVESLKERALAIAGKYRSNVTDLSKSHDRYLAEELER
jgi:Ribbon-helix-helix protein, copG family.